MTAARGAAPPGVSAIVLAAGESTRMGEQKALMAFAGTTLIEYQVTQLQRSGEIAEIVVVSGHNPDALAARVTPGPHLRVVHNPHFRRGKVGSIQVGLAAVSPQADSILVLAVDQPRPASLIRELVRRHHASPSSLISAPTVGGRRGHPLLIRRALFGELERMSEEERGLRAVVARHAADLAECELDDPRVLIDLNTPADREAARALQW